MKSIYFSTPAAAVAANFKSGSATLARAIIAAHHPELETMLHTPPGTGNGVAYPTSKGPDDIRWHGLCPKVKPEERPVVLLSVREPVSKFRSACAESNVADVDAKLAALETDGWGRDPHFWPQTRLVAPGENRLYRFPEDLDALATEAGLSLPLPDIDGGHNRPKPELTEIQEARVVALYAEDLALYNSIQEAGQILFGPEPEPEPLPPPVPVRAWRVRAIAKLQGLHEGILAAIGSLDDPQKTVLLEAYTGDAEIDPFSVSVVALAAALELETEQMHDLFRAAAALEV